MVECGGLENRYRCKPIEGSNPSSSASFFIHLKAHTLQFVPEGNDLYSRSFITRCGAVM